MSCQHCGRDAPTARAAFHQHIGLLLFFLHSRRAGRFCRSCLRKMFVRTSAITAFFGWWGVISFFVTLFVLPWNLVQWVRASSSFAHGASDSIDETKIPEGAKDLRFGWPATVLPIWAFFVWACGYVYSGFLFLDTLGSPQPLALAMAAAPATLDLLVTPALAIALLLQARRVDQGTPGRFRVALVSVASLLRVSSMIAFAGLLVLIFLEQSAREYFVATTSFEVPNVQGLWSLVYSLVESNSQLYVIAFWGLLGFSALAFLAQTVAAISMWWLVPRRVRIVIWAIVDIALFVTFWAVTLLLPMKPPEDAPDAVLWPAVRIAVTAVAAVRYLVRLIPIALDVAEIFGFRLIVAARMLRARKSGFITIIGGLSIVAVAISSCMLTSVLSVMGGFRNDLKDKILGNNAHVVIDRERATIDGWEPVLESVRRHEGVVAATPYASGEVMITSATNLSGAILRGIDPETIGRVTDLPRNMRHGSLRYLSHPERLLRLAPDEMGRGLLVPRIPFEDDGDDPPPPIPDRGGVITDIEESVRQADEEDRFLDPEIERIQNEIDPFLLPEGDSDLSPSSDPSEREVLPGIIVGQELARTLRLHVGDEVDVVSPFGELGPSGPIPKTRPFRVAGIFYSGMYEFDMKVAYTSLEDAQRFLNMGDAIHGIEIKVDDSERAEPIARSLDRAIDRRELRVRAWQEVNRNLFGALQLEKLAMFITLGIAILVASFCIIGSLILMVQEKAREIGILKAMGATGEQIVAVFMAQGLMIGLLGAVMGLGSGYVTCFLMEHFGVHLNPEVYYIDRLPVHIDGVEFGLVGIAAVVICLIATIYPAILASTLRPVDALRYS